MIFLGGNKVGGHVKLWLVKQWGEGGNQQTRLGLVCVNHRHWVVLLEPSDITIAGRRKKKNAAAPELSSRGWKKKVSWERQSQLAGN